MSDIDGVEDIPSSKEQEWGSYSEMVGSSKNVNIVLRYTQNFCVDYNNSVGLFVFINWWEYRYVFNADWMLC